MKNVLKKIGKGYLIFLVIYWSVAGFISLAQAGANWGMDNFRMKTLRSEMHRRFGR